MGGEVERMQHMSEKLHTTFARIAMRCKSVFLSEKCKLLQSLLGMIILNGIEQW